jgi:hypothetical protein
MHQASRRRRAGGNVASLDLANVNGFKATTAPVEPLLARVSMITNAATIL